MTTKIKRWNPNDNPITLLPCPFCGSEPTVTHKGSDHTKARGVIISCPSCRVKRMDAAIRYGFSWLEEVAAKNWNKRAQ